MDDSCQKPLFTNRIMWFIAAFLLIAHFTLAMSSATRKSCTVDEYNHLRSGYSFWAANDYTTDPESGNLSKRFAALPFLFSKAWNTDSCPSVFPGRVMIALLSVILGLIVFSLSKHLFGIYGGLISLALYSLSPTMLAHARLITSDIAAALFFIAAVFMLWQDMQKTEKRTFFLTPLVVAGLVLSKMSGLLIIPIALLLLGIRLVWGNILIINFPIQKKVVQRLYQLFVLLSVFVAQSLMVLIIIWSFYGFRYNASSEPLKQAGFEETRWAVELDKTGSTRPVVEFLKDHKILPESYIFGLAHVLGHTRDRVGFMNGNFSLKGWWFFFPFCFLVKTPMSLFLILGLSVFALAFCKIPRLWYRLAPFLALLAIYWCFAIGSGLNIGHRHILVTYPVLFILAGALAALFFDQRKRLAMLAVLALVGFAAESFAIWPDYLAFFNLAAGGPGKGYKRLVDSSLDWGQDLPGLKKWMDARAGDNTPVYLSYFGIVEPECYEINAKKFPRNFGESDVLNKKTPTPLLGGYYCISATNLQQMSIGRAILGKWCVEYENIYQQLTRRVRAYQEAGAKKYLAAAGPKAVENLVLTFYYYEEYRFSRLCAYLRQKSPDAYIGYSILIYKLTDDEIHEALFGPPAELYKNSGIQKS